MIKKPKTNEERIEDLKEALITAFELHSSTSNDAFWDTREKSFKMITNCGCHQKLMDYNCGGVFKPYLSEFEELVNKHDAWIEMENGEAVTIWLNDKD